MTSRRLTPLGIALAYLGFAVAALALTDFLLAAVVRSPERFRELRAIAGVGQVGLTAVFIYLLTYRGQRSLQRANERLSRQRRALAVLQRVLRHNIRNHMTVVKGRAEHLLNGDADEEQVAEVILDTADDVVDDAVRAGRIKELVADESGQYRVDLATAVSRAVSKARENHPSATIALTVDETAVTEASILLTDAVEELVTNAVEHGSTSSRTQSDAVEHGSASSRPAAEDGVERGSTSDRSQSGDGEHAPTGNSAHSGDEDDLHVSVTVCARDEWGVVRVEDDGPGIPPEEYELVTGETEITQLRHSSGLGLWLAYWTVEHADGHMDVETRESGSTVTLTFPRLAASP